MTGNEPDGPVDGPPVSVRRLPGGVSILSASGSVDGATPSLIGRLVADELAREPAQLVLELSRATSVGSTFVEALADASALAGEADISFCLVVPATSPVAEALATANLTERFEIFTSMGRAQLQR